MQAAGVKTRTAVAETAKRNNLAVKRQAVAERRNRIQQVYSTQVQQLAGSGGITQKTVAAAGRAGNETQEKRRNVNEVERCRIQQKRQL